MLGPLDLVIVEMHHIIILVDNIRQLIKVEL